MREEKHDLHGSALLALAIALTHFPPQRAVAALLPLWERLPPAHLRAVQSSLRALVAKLPAPGRPAIDKSELERWFRQGKSQRWMAKKLQISQSTVSRLFRSLRTAN